MACTGRIIKGEATTQVRCAVPSLALYNVLVIVAVRSYSEYSVRTANATKRLRMEPIMTEPKAGLIGAVSPGHRALRD